METPTLIWIFFALCGAGILLALVAPRSRQGNVLVWLGCLASMALVFAGGNTLLAGKTFSQPLWTLPELAATLTLKLDSLSAVFIVITGLVLFPAIFAPVTIQNSPPFFIVKLFVIRSAEGISICPSERLR